MYIHFFGKVAFEISGLFSLQTVIGGFELIGSEAGVGVGVTGVDSGGSDKKNLEFNKVHVLILIWKIYSNFLFTFLNVIPRRPRDFMAF